jgi:hypothetical protein
MVYLIYKGDSAKELLKKTLVNINSYLYKDGNDFSNSIHFIDYLSMNKELLKRIDDYNIELFEENNNFYYRTYSMNNYQLVRNMINMITSLKASRDDSKYFNLFYNSLITEFTDKLTNTKTERTPLDDVTDLALLAFSNSDKYTKNNDLLYGLLYDQKEIEINYNNIMGEGSFDKLNKLCQMEEIHYSLEGSISPNEYKQIITILRRYFYKKIHKMEDLPIHEKNSMVINFNSMYRQIKDKVELEEYKKKRF